MLSMKQDRANLAIELLEPEAPNSFVSWSLITVKKGQIIPVFRCMTKPF